MSLRAVRAEREPERWSYRRLDLAGHPVSQERRGELLTLLACPANLVGRRKVPDDFLDVTNLDRSALLHVGLRPLLARNERPDEEHLLAVLQGKARLHLGPGRAGRLDDDGPLAESRGDDVTAREGVPTRRAGWPELRHKCTMARDLFSEFAVLGGVALGDARAPDMVTKFMQRQGRL